MKKRFSEEQIIGFLREAEAGGFGRNDWGPAGISPARLPLATPRSRSGSNGVGPVS